MSRDSDDHKQRHSNIVSSPARTPAPPKGEDLLQGGEDGDSRKSGTTPSPKVHREPYSAQVKTK
jgi:hypothetical protein